MFRCSGATFLQVGHSGEGLVGFRPDQLSSDAKAKHSSNATDLLVDVFSAPTDQDHPLPDSVKAQRAELVGGDILVELPGWGQCLPDRPKLAGLFAVLDVVVLGVAKIGHHQFGDGNACFFLRISRGSLFLNEPLGDDPLVFRVGFRGIEFPQIDVATFNSHSGEAARFEVGVLRNACCRTRHDSLFLGERVRYPFFTEY